jgi:hypothetical protein
MTRKIMIFVFLVSLAFEILLVMSTVADLRPRSSAATEALFAYQNYPTKETRDRWDQEHDKMNQEVRTKRIIGYSLLVGNGLMSNYFGAKLIKRRVHDVRHG